MTTTRNQRKSIVEYWRKTRRKSIQLQLNFDKKHNKSLKNWNRENIMNKTMKEYDGKLWENICQRELWETIGKYRECPENTSKTPRPRKYASISACKRGWNWSFPLQLVLYIKLAGLNNEWTRRNPNQPKLPPNPRSHVGLFLGFALFKSICDVLVADDAIRRNPEAHLDSLNVLIGFPRLIWGTSTHRCIASSYICYRRGSKFSGSNDHLQRFQL